MNPAQQAIVQSDAPLICVLASAGSGKTRVLIERIQRLIRLGTDPQKIVALSYTREASAEIAVRLGITIGFCGTLHSFLLKLIQQNAERLGYASSRLVVLEEPAADELLARCAEDVGCRSSLRQLKSALVAETAPRAIRTGLALEQLALKRYFKTLRQHGLISYDGILAEGLRLLKSPHVNRENFPFTHLFVDELQDASELDFEIYRTCWILFTHCFFVGDDSQAIFSFRGGSSECLLKMTRTTGFEVHALNENYRSDRAICAAAQRLIEHNKDRYPKILLPISTDEGRVSVRQFKSPVLEQAAVIEAIQKESGTCAVLVRNRKGNAGTGALVQDWVECLTASGIPVQTNRMKQKSADWALLKAAIAVLIDPTNDWACYNLIRLKDGEAAHEIKLLAQASGRSINDSTLHLPTDLVPMAYKPILARIGVSLSSLELFDLALEKLGPDEHGTELLALLSEDDEQVIGQGVTVTTLHGAKGREFSAVFLPAFEDEIIPSRKTGPELDEERRLSYVGFTRARHHLWISHVESRKPLFGGWHPQPVNPSRFIKEAGL
jgi:DNA helicase-2/ATP-dependent DNA helicase PcrA